MINRLRSYMRSVPFYVYCRHYGTGNTLRRYRYNRKIRKTAALETLPVGSKADCEVHVLTSLWDWDLAIWGIKSFYHHAKVDWPLVIHDGGLQDDYRAALARQFPNARIIHPVEANQKVEEILHRQGHTSAVRARASYTLMKKAIDTTLLAQTSRILLLDSDVLFFSPPTDLLAYARNENDQIVFLRDYQDAYTISSKEAQDFFGYALPPRINSGLAVIPTHLIDLKFLEEVFKSGKIPLNRDGQAEQTVLALAAAKSGFKYLPDHYTVVTGPSDLARSGEIARHYVGPVKTLFYDEGVPHLMRTSNIV